MVSTQIDGRKMRGERTDIHRLAPLLQKTQIVYRGHSSSDVPTKYFLKRERQKARRRASEGTGETAERLKGGNSSSSYLRWTERKNYTVQPHVTRRSSQRRRITSQTPHICSSRPRRFLSRLHPKLDHKL
ncbi:hypothetical protein QQF64_002255 [Cirrhinus molitorella]|uniref:Uncharacterized protein n=2 Tax=Cirrhinus molitorella TaxID=172907 RepID=A0AA88P586_9TELE|nr:hypothetical protein Q8A67_023639 [Cirrhinus molitorella]